MLTGITALGPVGALGLAGCTAGSVGPGSPGSPASTGSASAGPTGSSDDASGSASAAPQEADDTALLASVRGELAALAATVAAARRGAPALRGDLAPLLALHRVHAEALGEPLARGRPDRSAGAAGAQLARVRDGEERWQRRLVGYSVQAQSGSLARLLASMSAGTAQRLAVLPDSVGGTR